jgi:hypothetical protein
MRLIDPRDWTTQQGNGQKQHRNRQDRQQTETKGFPLLSADIRCRFRSENHFDFLAAFFPAFLTTFLVVPDASADLAPFSDFFVSPVAFFLSPKARSQFFQNSGVVPVRTIGPLIDSASSIQKLFNPASDASSLTKHSLSSISGLVSLTLLMHPVKQRRLSPQLSHTIWP